MADHIDLTKDSDDERDERQSTFESDAALARMEAELAAQISAPPPPPPAGSPDSSDSSSSDEDGAPPRRWN